MACYFRVEQCTTTNAGIFHIIINYMGNCCIPDSPMDSLELTISTPQQRTRNEDSHLKLRSEQPTHITNSCEDEPKWEKALETPCEHDYVLNLKGLLQSCISVTEDLRISDYSKLNRHEFRQVVVPPSSGRLTVIEQLENESILPDEIFLLSIRRSGLRKLGSLSASRLSRASSLKWAFLILMTFPLLLFVGSCRWALLVLELFAKDWQKTSDRVSKYAPMIGPCLWIIFEELDKVEDRLKAK